MVVVSIDRIGRRWLDTMGNIHDLQRRGVRIRSLADNEQSWTQYLDADPDSPESFLGYTLAGFAAWVSDGDSQGLSRRGDTSLIPIHIGGRALGLILSSAAKADALSPRHRHFAAQELFAIKFSEVEPARDVADIAYLQNQRSVTHKAGIDYESEFPLVAVPILFVEDGLHVTKTSVK